MSLDQFDDFAWPADPLAAVRPRRHATPPIATSLDCLSAEERQTGAWHDDFLLLGSRLRPIFNEGLTLDAETPAYLVSMHPDVVVRVTCPVDVERADRVRMWCPLVEPPDASTGLFEFSMRENAELPLVRLAFADGCLLVEYELPFAAAGIPALRSAVAAVSYAAARLRPELRAVFPRAA